MYFFNIDNIPNDILEVLQLVLLLFNSEFVQRKCEIIKTNEKKGHKTCATTAVLSIS